MGAPNTWTKQWESCEASSDAQRGDSYSVGYLAPSGTTLADAKAAFPMYSPHPMSSGLFASLVYNHRVRSDAGPGGLTAVTIYWKPPSIRRALERNPGRGIVLADVSGDEQRAVEDLDGRYVWHEEWRSAAGKWHLVKWEPVNGKGTIQRSRCVLRLRVAADHSFGGSLMALMDTVNSGAVLGAGAGTLRFMGYHAERALTTDALTYYDALMEYNAARWNSDTVVQGYEYVVRRTQVYDSDGAAIADRYKDVGAWEPSTEPAAYYTARLYPAVSWAAVERMVGW